MLNINNVGIHNLSPGMVTTDLLMAGTHFTFVERSPELLTLMVNATPDDADEGLWWCGRALGHWIEEQELWKVDSGSKAIQICNLI